MADVATTFSTLSQDAPNVWIAQQTYRLAERNLRIGKYARRYQLPQRMGTTLRIIRHSRLALPTTVLTEGTPPDAVALAVENVDVTVEQWGIVVLLTDVAMVTTKHPALQVAINRVALAMSEVLEREMAVVLLAGTQVFFPGTATSRATLLNTDVMSTAVVLNSTVQLRTNGAGEMDGGLFSGVMSPQQEGDVISADATFKDASNFANVKALQFGEIGIWMGVRWSRGNFLPIFQGVAVPSTQAALVAGEDMSGSGSGIDGSLIVVVGRDATHDYERIVSQTLTVADTDGTFTLDLPTSTNYVWDVYMTDPAGANNRLVASRQAASTAITVNAALYSAGTSASNPEAPAVGVTAYIAYVFGEDSFGRVELNGLSLESFITPPGASFSNPLAQGRKVGSKIMWKSFIIDDSFYARLETGSSFSSGLPS